MPETFCKFSPSYVVNVRVISTGNGFAGGRLSARNSLSLADVVRPSRPVLPLFFVARRQAKSVDCAGRIPCESPGSTSKTGTLELDLAMGLTFRGSIFFMSICRTGFRSGSWHVFLCAFLTAAAAFAQDPGCPAYPTPVRVEAERTLDLHREFARRRGLNPVGVAVATPPSRNVVDDWIFKKMVSDGVDAAPLTTDSEFVRRIYLDLTGRVPTFEQVKAFVADTSPTKRDKLIDTLLASPGYVDQFAFWFRKRVQIVRGNNSSGGSVSIGIPERNHFYSFVRPYVEQDRPYDAFARDIITASGDTDTAPATAPFSRQVTEYYTSAQQDFWDNFTDLTTTQFLGFHTSCVSCHN